MRTSALMMTAALSLAGCADRGLALTLSPAEGPSSGYYPVVIDLSESSIAASEVEEVWVGGLRALPLDGGDDAALRVEVQGAPTPGEAEVVLWIGGAPLHSATPFTYAPPTDPLFDEVWALGASVSLGVRSGALSPLDQRRAPVALIAQGAGAFLSLPLLTDGLLVPADASAIGPAPECALADFVEVLGGQLSGALGSLQGDDGVDMARSRQDPELEARQLAVPGVDVGDLVNGIPISEITEHLFGKMVLEPWGSLADELERGPLERVEAGAPTLILALDLFPNDLIDALTGDNIDVDAMRSVEEIEPNLREVVDRLAATGATVVIGNCPDVTDLPLAAQQRRRALAAGEDPEEVDAKLQVIRDRALAINAMLDEVAAGYDQVLVWDFMAAAHAVAADGLPVGEGVLTGRPYGGLASLDGVHFSHTGNGVMANEVLAFIEAETGARAARVDLEALRAEDPCSPEALAEQGFDVGACEL